MKATPEQTAIEYGFVPAYERKGFYSLEQVHAHIGEMDVDFDGDLINVVSVRHRVFSRSPDCVFCGRIGVVYAKERSAKRLADGTHKATTERWHFNLYARDPDGRLVLMTKDHIKARSQGGSDDDGNLQTACTRCNTAKGWKDVERTPEAYAEIGRKANPIRKQRRQMEMTHA